MFSGTFCFGQNEYLPVFEGYDSVRWSSTFRFVDFSGSNFEIITRMTVIDSTLSRFGIGDVRKFAYTDSFSNGHFQLREDTSEKKIYAYGELYSTEYKVYDFALEVGDTFEFFTFDFTGELFNQCEMEVEKVDTLDLFGKDRKVISFQSSTKCFWDMKFIEGIGTNYGFDYFLAEHWFFDAPYPNLLCTFKNGHQVYGDSICFVQFSDVEKQSSKNLISIYPNPTNSHLSITFPPNQNGEFEFQLFTITGKKIKIESVSHFSQSIDLQSIASGLYIYKIIDSGRVIQIDKLEIIR